MTVFEPHEVQVLELLTRGRLADSVLRDVVENASFVDLNETGVGYFLTVEHAALPAARTVCDKPLLVGRAGRIECGFVVFLESQQLMLECHSWGLGAIPKGFRERDIVVAELERPDAGSHDAPPPP